MGRGSSGYGWWHYNNLKAGGTTEYDFLYGASISLSFVEDSDKKLEISVSNKNAFPVSALSIYDSNKINRIRNIGILGNGTITVSPQA